MNSFEEQRLSKTISEIDKMVNDEVDYIDAVVHYAEINGIEIEALAELLKKSVAMTSKIRSSAEQLNLLEKTRTLF